LRAVLGLLLGLALAAPSLGQLAAEPPPLPKRFGDWLESVDAFLTPAERTAFLALSKDYQRDAFIDRFWRERDPYPETGRNELRDRWAERVAVARSRFGKLDDLRSRLVLLNGMPTTWRPLQCRMALWSLELWFYALGSDRWRDPFALIVVKRGTSLRLWHPSDGFDELVEFDTTASCHPNDSRLLNSAIGWMRDQPAFDYADLLARVQKGPDPASPEWVATFNAYSTDLPAAATTFEGRVLVDFPGWYQNRTVVQGAIEIPAQSLALAEAEGHRSYNLLLTGEILTGAALFDSFRYRFDLAPSEETIRLVFQRYLRPETEYTLVLKVEDLNSGKLFRREQPLLVPRVTGQRIPPPSDPRVAEALAEANRALANGETTVQLIPPIGDLLTGLVRFDTVVTGDAVRSVTFTLNDEQRFTKNRAPFSVELDLGSFPRVHTLRATAFDGAGQELASDELAVNIVGNRFRVRLLEPQRGRVYKTSLRARAEVEVPKGEAIERVEMYLNDERVATLYQPPYVQPIELPPQAGELTYVRAVAFRPDGSFAEDLVFVNAPDFAEELDIQFVELFTSVLDRQGRPIVDLEARDFVVKEDGVAQDLRRFERVRDLPFHALILLDTSASMGDKLEPARQAALSFFRKTVREKDRAGVIVFNDRPYLASPFTNQAATFAGGLAGLKAERGTALYDSLIYSLFYFSGLSGQKALVLLSDGKDEASRFRFEQALEYVRRAGVTLYTVAVGLDKKEGAVGRKNLERLAEETGGRSFFLDSTSQLDATYEAIEEELRSQYLLAYQSKNLSRSSEFRTVEVDVDKSGAEAKTLRGYYP
jgi:Ca-activated chloride channel homolog